MTHSTRFSAFLGLLLLFGCASSGKSATDVLSDLPTPPSAPELPAYDLIHDRAGTFTMTRLSDGRSVEIGKGERISMVLDAPDQKRVIIETTGEDATMLWSVQREYGLVMSLGGGPPSMHYTADWNADGTELAFAWRYPEGNGSNSRGVQRFLATEGQMVNVGCSASDTVVAWLADGSLLLGGGDKLYIVDADDCATLRTIDARKMYHVTVSPDGAHLAWIQRELVYNRDQRAYEPDSTLYVTTFGSADTTKVLGDRFGPRHLAFSPDGTELGFDVELPDMPGRREVSIFSVDAQRTSYLIPPSQGDPSRTRPVFSPSGRHVMFVSGSGAEAAYMVKRAGEQFARPVPALENSRTRDVQWVSDTTVLILGEDDTSVLVDLVTGKAIDTPAITDIRVALAPR